MNESKTVKVNIEPISLFVRKAKKELNFVFKSQLVDLVNIIQLQLKLFNYFYKIFSIKWIRIGIFFLGYPICKHSLYLITKNYK